MVDIQNVSIAQSQLDENGLVFCWEIKQKKWVKRFPIDAREGIACGLMNLQGPDEGPHPNAKQSTAEDHEATFAAMSKSSLRTLCVKNEVQHGGADTKTSLIKRLISTGIIPE